MTTPRPQEVANEALWVDLCGPEDRAEQARLFNAVFKKHVDAAALKWRYDTSPHGSSVSLLARPPGADGARTEGICGYACSPRVFVPSGKLDRAAPVGETGDVMTHPDWRRRGIFSMLDERCMEETARRGWPCVFGLPNRHSADIFLGLGWERIGTIRHWTHVLRADDAARAERLREGRLAAWCVSLAARKAARARQALAERAGGRHDVAPIDRFPSECADLFNEVAGRYALIVRRRPEDLDWRFIDNPSGLHRAFAVRLAGALRGYVVVQVPRPGERKGFLVDLLAADDSAAAAGILAGLEALEAAGASVVQAHAVDRSPWQRELARAGFLPPKADNHLIVILYVHDPEHPVTRAARDASTWWVTDGDRDDETVG